MATTTAHAIYQRLSKLDYSKVDHAFHQQKIKPLTIAAMRKETLRFLSLCATSDKPLGPSTLVDKYWHQLILNTHLYAKAAKACGKFVHHEPNDGSKMEQEEDAKAFWETIKAYDETFGEPDITIWKVKRR